MTTMMPMATFMIAIGEFWLRPNEPKRRKEEIGKVIFLKEERWLKREAKGEEREEVNQIWMKIL